jgi:hypothetical protein
MIDAPQKADGQWLYLNFHCQSNTPVAHHFDNQLGLQSKHSARAIGAYQRARRPRTTISFWPLFRSAAQVGLA